MRGAILIFLLSFFVYKPLSACNCYDYCQGCSNVDSYHACVMDCGEPGKDEGALFNKKGN